MTATSLTNDAARAERTGGSTRHFTCDRVSHTFAGDRGAVVALTDVSLAVDVNEFVCIVGPSGCGKSTLLRIIAGLQEPSSGAVRFEGESAGHRVRGGLVVQEHGTFPWMSAVDNVAFGLELQGVPKAGRRARAMAYLERVGLSGFASHYPHELSVGMRQRLGIGRAMVVDAPLLLMDEPFAALDAQTRRRMQRELLGIWAADRRTVVFVTHDIDEAVLLGDRVVVMSERPGRIIANVAVPFARPRDLRRDAAEARAIVEDVWRLLDSSPEQGTS
ncbi:MAG TPA: ABC transporter ATP-binding protein [Gemmatimonadaceae bacterium]|nr:ABC transporter ATP-binding protein [Gemmatimonadaceae bacterium]